MTGIERVTTDDGVSIAYKTVGVGPCKIIALHGWGGAGTGSSWREIADHLDLAGITLVTIDLRGHGESDRTESGFTLERFAGDILAVADKLEAERFVLVGYSMSGRWAQWISSNFPKRVLGQILIAPAPAKPLALGDELPERWIRDTGNRESFEAFVRQFTSEPVSERMMDGYFEDVSKASSVAKRETLRMCCSGDFSSDLARVSSPTLVLAGNYDPMLSPDFLHQEIVGKISGARLIKLSCGHEIPIEKSGETAALIEAFVAGLNVRV